MCMSDKFMNLSDVHYPKCPAIFNFIRSGLRIICDFFAIYCKLFDDFYRICYDHNIAG
jgi:hypothetical protein